MLISECGFMCEKCLNNATCEQCSAGYTAKNPGLLTCDGLYLEQRMSCGNGVPSLRHNAELIKANDGSFSLTCSSDE